MEIVTTWALPDHTDPPAKPSVAMLSPVCVLPDAYDDIAPDGSEVRLLGRTTRASMAHFRLQPGQVTVGVVHCRVDEIWFVTSGAGRIWRCPDGRPALAKEDELRPHMSITIPVGTHFQFRSYDCALEIVGVTVPPWPGEDEAVASEIMPWKAEVLSPAKSATAVDTK